MAADVCSALTVGNITDAMRRLDDDEKGFDSIETPGGMQRVIVVNESGLYSLILGSRKPEAKRFKKWVTAEVLPAIRKTVQDTGLTTDSRRVAKHFGKRHDNVLRAYDNLRLDDAEFDRLNFEVVEEPDAKGQTRRVLRMTKDGFMFLAMSFTGKEAAAVVGCCHLWVCDGIPQK